MTGEFQLLSLQASAVHAVTVFAHPGESYGGRYVLLFASAILDQNAHRLQNGREPINVASIAIGVFLSGYPMIAGPVQGTHTSTALL